MYIYSMGYICCFYQMFQGLCLFKGLRPGLSSLGLLGMPWHPQIMADQLTITQPGGEDYAHHIATATPGFSDLPTALTSTLESRLL